MYSSIKKYYDKGFYTVEQTKIFVVAKYITVEEFHTITGVTYVA